MVYIKCLETIDKKAKRKLSEPKRNIMLGLFLWIVSPICTLLGATIAGNIGLIIGILFTVSLILAGIYQFAGICETRCPYCNEKVYVKKESKSYKCKYCGLLSIVQDEE